MTFCPFCGVRPDVDLRQIHFRDLGVMEALSCPRCTTDLHMLEFDFQPPLRIERCHSCTGLFFNPNNTRWKKSGVCTHRSRNPVAPP